MQCPVCNVPLNMSNRQEVEIDYCPQCRGVWLDRGELDKIIERSVAFEAPQKVSQERRYEPESSERRPKRDYDDDDRDDRYPKKKKRGSFLGELFDF